MGKALTENVCIRCGKDKGANRFYCNTCHKALTDTCADGFEMCVRDDALFDVLEALDAELHPYERRWHSMGQMGQRGEEVYNQINEQIELFKTNAAKFYEGNKSAGTRARKALDAIAKLKVLWRKETV